MGGGREGRERREGGEGENPTDRRLEGNTNADWGENCQILSAGRADHSQKFWLLGA